MSNESEADEPAEADAESDEPEASGLQEEDFVELDYTARTVESDQLVDTTDPEVAETEDIDTDQEFSPRTIVLGEGHIFDSVEEDILGSEVGDSGTVTVVADEAFGEVDEDKKRTISKDKIPEDDRYPGAQVTVDNQQGFIETIIGGRARVDFNHPLAGDDIEYEYEIVGQVEDRQERAEGLLNMFLDLDLEVWFETDTVDEERLVEDDENEEPDSADADDADEATDEDTDDEASETADDADDETAVEDEDEGADEPEYETVEVERESLFIEATPQLTMNQQWMMQKQQIAQQLTTLLDIDRVVIQEVLGDSPGMGMPGMFGGGGGDIEEMLEDADIDADELAAELEE